MNNGENRSKPKIMKRINFILLLIIVVFVLSNCGIPKEVKLGSRMLISAQEKFLNENYRFYDIVEKTLSDYIDIQISNLQIQKEKKLKGIQEEISDEFFKKKRKKKNVVDKNPIFISEIDFKNLFNAIHEKQNKHGEIYDNQIKVLEKRKENISMAIKLLKSYQKAIYAGNMSLDNYIQVEKYSEVLWQEAKNLIEGKNGDIDKLINIIEKLRRN